LPSKLPSKSSVNTVPAQAPLGTLLKSPDMAPPAPKIRSAIIARTVDLAIVMVDITLFAAWITVDDTPTSAADFPAAYRAAPAVVSAMSEALTAADAFVDEAAR